MYENNLITIIDQHLLKGAQDTDIAYFAKDRQGKVIACNALYYKLAGFSCERAIIGKTMQQVSWRQLASFYAFVEKMVLNSGAKYLNIEKLPVQIDGSNSVISEKKPIVINGHIYGYMGRFKVMKKAPEITIIPGRYNRQQVVIKHLYFVDIILPLKLFQILIYVTFYQLDYKSVANLVHCSESTIKKHIGMLYDRFGLYDQQRNLNELQKISRLFIGQRVVEMCFDLHLEGQCHLILPFE
ncbi:transcriptional regulator [Facilibium subflavum]|uniref:hypothetical protein n=1 Tax=Facilibium subflavum TaxID=2219058 RepID=UPI000E6547F3|nr:hypothetical protein [Facilibium subflavum]